MKISVGGGGYIEPDDGPRDTRFHKRIVKVEKMSNTRSGHWVDLECGHRVATFGNLEYAEGVIRCTECRDAAEDRAQ